MIFRTFTQDLEAFGVRSQSDEPGKNFDFSEKIIRVFTLVRTSTLRINLLLL